MTQKEFNNLKAGDKLRILKHDEHIRHSDFRIGEVYKVTIVVNFHHQINTERKMICIRETSGYCWSDPECFEKPISFDSAIKNVYTEIERLKANV